MMSRGRPIYIQAAAACIVVVVSAFLGPAVLPIHAVETGRLAQLVPADPPPGFNSKPTAATVQDSTQSTFAVVKNAAKRSPHETGTYTISWSGKTSGDSASILMSLVPTNSEGTTLLGQVKKSALGTGTYQSDSYKYQSFTVPGIPGSGGARYAPTTASVKQQLSVAVVPFHKVVAVVYVDQTGAQSLAQQNDVALAQSEYRQLERRVPGFTLATTRWPAAATAIWASGTAVLAIGIAIVPTMVRRARTRRELARQEAARRRVMARGSKIARRRARSR